MSQNQVNINSIKEKAGKIHKVFMFLFIIGIIFVGINMIANVVMIFVSPEKFNAVQESFDWTINYIRPFGNPPLYPIHIPFRIIPPSLEFSAKYAAITYLFSQYLLGYSCFIYGCKQVLNIFESAANDITPFIMDNVKSIKNIATTIIAFSVIVDNLTSILCTLFVTHTYVSFHFGNFNINGIILGTIIFFIADIFKYGVFLQKEFDETL